jgi:Rrf2 family protein
MKLSLKVEYACQVLAQLGGSYGAQELPHIEDLATREHIPSNYLVQILNELRTAGLIISRRGKQGGYALARPAADISLYDVIKAVEGDVLGHSGGNQGASANGAREVWDAVGKEFSDMLKRYRIEHIRNGASDPMWYI